jgi:hypothetical protein
MQWGAVVRVGERDLCVVSGVCGLGGPVEEPAGQKATAS